MKAPSGAFFIVKKYPPEYTNERISLELQFFFYFRFYYGLFLQVGLIFPLRLRYSLF